MSPPLAAGIDAEMTMSQKKIQMGRRRTRSSTIFLTQPSQFFIGKEAREVVIYLFDILHYGSSSISFSMKDNPSGESLTP